MPTPVVLHCCCAPCSSAIIEWMLQNDYRPVIFYCNPNIYPQEEYLIRKEEITRYAQKLGLEIVEDSYAHEAWLEAVKGQELEPERGARCLLCFKLRLLATAKFAQARGIELFTTTLASSRWKSLTQINEAGVWAAEQVNTGEEATRPVFCEAGRTACEALPVRFWEKNWRKGGLQERRNQLLEINQFYNQQYCGCEFSFRQV